MIDGIYRITYSTSTGDLGEGIVVIKQGSLNGGDRGFVYAGTLAADDDHFTTQLTMTRWDPQAFSPFGPLTDFVADFTGKVMPDKSLVAEGRLLENPQYTLTIHAKYLAAAV